MASLVNSTNIQKIINTYPSETLPKNIKRRECSQTHFTKPALPNAKTRERHRKRKLQVNIPNQYGCKNPLKILANQIQHLKRIIHWNMWDLAQRGFNICKSINVLHHINKMKGQNHTVISVDAESI